MSRTAAFVASMLACAAFAQETPVATQVNGLVTIGQGANVGLLQAGTPIVDGTRIVTGSTGSVTLDVSAACSIDIGPGQAFTFVAGSSCSELQASIVSIAGKTQLAGGLSTGNLLLAAGALSLVGATVSAGHGGRSAPISGQ